MPQSMLMFALVGMAMGGLAWVFIYPLLSGERKAEKRQQSVVRTEAPASGRVPRNAGKPRREQIEATLKEIDQRRAKSASLSRGILAVAAFLAGLLANAGLLTALGFGFAAGAGFPHWLLKFLKKRREAKFLLAFPDAVDIIVRGVKAGLPLLDSMRMITNDAPEPLCSEFRSILEVQAFGLPIGEACGKLYERVPLPEANFFAIVVSIQEKAGGNLSEALGNLSRVLRDRKKMKAKIQAMSMEAKASAAIIGALPLAVMGLVYITSPHYIELLWTESLGRIMMLCCGCWMLMGVMVMRKMINFDF
jgi:tight adherence protein B